MSASPLDRFSLKSHGSCQARHLFLRKGSIGNRFYAPNMQHADRIWPRHGSSYCLS